eukprot:1571429-Rhodomonas_salina.1
MINRTTGTVQADAFRVESPNRNASLRYKANAESFSQLLSVVGWESVRLMKEMEREAPLVHEAYLKERKEFRQLFGIDSNDTDGHGLDVLEEEKSILKILEEITESGVSSQEVVDYVCCE